MQKQELISQCAESKVYAADFCGSPAVLKHRFVKAFRHPTLDQLLRTQRTQREARALARCRKFEVAAPTLFSVDKGECTILMERIIGRTVRDVINEAHAEDLKNQGPANRANSSSNNSVTGMGSPINSVGSDGAVASGGGASTILDAVAKDVLTQVGILIGRLHNGDIIHGDLTTSNFMLRDSDKSVVVIDFGLVSDSSQAESRAVDLYVLERAVVSAHPFLTNASEIILAGYRMAVDGAKGAATIARLEDVRARGRKRSMIG